VISISLAACVLLPLTGEQQVLRTSGEEYSPPGGNFTIRFPGMPKESEQTTESAIGKVNVFTATYATSEGNVYMVSYSDLPEGAAKKDKLKSLFEGVREGALGKEKDNIEVTEDKEFKFGPDDLSAFRLSFKKELKKEKTSLYTKLRVIVRDNRLYQIAVVGTSKFVEKEGKAFLDSFAVVK
jgi:hypothetical protein